MGRSRRKVDAIVEESLNPPDALPAGYSVKRIVKAMGNNVYQVESPSGERTIVEMHSRFRSTIWVKKGSVVVVDTSALAARENKLGGEIVKVALDEKLWRTVHYWPKEFTKQSGRIDIEQDGEDSLMGKMPPEAEEPTP